MKDHEFKKDRRNDGAVNEPLDDPVYRKLKSISLYTGWILAILAVSCILGLLASLIVCADTVTRFG